MTIWIIVGRREIFAVIYAAEGNAAKYAKRKKKKKTKGHHIHIYAHCIHSMQPTFIHPDSFE